MVHNGLEYGLMQAYAKGFDIFRHANSKNPEGLHVGDATVLWVKGYEFGLEIQDMNPIDQEWLTQFLDHALGLWLVPRAA